MDNSDDDILAKRYLDIADVFLAVIDNRRRISLINQRGAEILGYDLQELLGKEFTQFLPSRLRKQIKGRFDSLLAGDIEPSESGQVTVFNRSGAERILSWRNKVFRDDAGRIVNILCTGEDITDRIQAETLIKESEQRYRLLAESALDYIFIIDKKLNVLYLNSFAAAQLHADPDNIIGRNLKDLFPGDTFKHFKRNIERVFISGRPLTVEDVTRLPHRDAWLLTKLVPLTDENGKTGSVMGIAHDITAHKNTLALNEALNEIIAAINSSLNFDYIMRCVAEKANDAIGSDSTWVVLNSGMNWVVRYHSGLLPKPVVGTYFTDRELPHLGLASRSRKPVIVEDAFQGEKIRREAMKKVGVRATLIIPLVTGEQVIGALAFNYHEAATAFTEEQADFAAKIGASITLAIDNARLYEDERRFADTIQGELLATPPSLPGVNYNCVYQTATDSHRIGGDFYDIFELPENRIAMLIGDVSGRGIAAVNAIASVKNMLKAYCFQGDSPEVSLEKVDKIFHGMGLSPLFVTIFLGVLDIKSGRLDYCGAGHPPPLLRANNGVVTLTSASPALGVTKKAVFTGNSIQMDRTDHLLLYTDGVIEARRDSDFFGLDRLNLLLSNYNQPFDAATRHILKEILSFTDNNLFDDIALMSVSLRIAPQFAEQ